MDHKGKNEVRVSTDTLMRRVMKSRQLDLFLNQNEANLEETTLSEYLERHGLRARPRCQVPRCGRCPGDQRGTDRAQLWLSDLQGNTEAVQG